jgi:hypothetical protein
MNIIKLHQELSRQSEKRNKTPLEDFDGFSPEEMYQILYFPFGENCPIKLRSEFNHDILATSPLMNIVMELLKNIENDGMKLTARGYLPPKVIREIYNKNYLPDATIESGISSLRTEQNWIAIHTTKIVLKLAGIIRQSKGKLFLTKKYGQLFKENDHASIFLRFLESFAMKFNWGYNDRYESDELGQLGFLFMLHLINKYGENFREIGFYTTKYLKAFPMFASQERYDNSSLGINWSERGICTRFFDRFANWFGFIEISDRKSKFALNRDDSTRRTDLLNQLIVLGDR